jgi:cell division protein FtsN
MADAQSSWASIQRQFPSVLGGVQPDIREANLGDRGIYYRVRIGPYASRSEAVELCEALQAAGGTCFVTR